MNPDEKGFLGAVKKNPTDNTSRSAYADWLDEHDRQYEAAIQRAKAGLSTVGYKIRRKSDGFFSNGNYSWHARGGKLWSRLADVISNIGSRSYRFRNDSKPSTYIGSIFDDIEIIFIELRVCLEVAMSVKEEFENNKRTVKTIEPIGE